MQESVEDGAGGRDVADELSPVLDGPVAWQTVSAVSGQYLPVTNHPQACDQLPDALGPDT